MVVTFCISDLLGQSGRLADPIALLVSTRQRRLRAGPWEVDQLLGCFPWILVC